MDHARAERKQVRMGYMAGNEMPLHKVRRQNIGKPFRDNGAQPGAANGAHQASHSLPFRLALKRAKTDMKGRRAIAHKL